MEDILQQYRDYREAQEREQKRLGIVVSGGPGLPLPELELIVWDIPRDEGDIMNDEKPTEDRIYYDFAANDFVIRMLTRSLCPCCAGAGGITVFVSDGTGKQYPARRRPCEHCGGRGTV